VTVRDSLFPENLIINLVLTRFGMPEHKGFLNDRKRKEHQRKDNKS
jgi:hypothetical protein